ncbi:MAG: hypothetical protein QOF66_1315 [Mycobacterium sp.]|jgi:hypothetical protein|nr:hypothetical protein [Mycobacterium sp.]
MVAHTVLVVLGFFGVTGGIAVLAALIIGTMSGGK